MTVPDFERIAQSWTELAPWLHVPTTEADYHRLVALLDELIDQVGEDERHALASLMDLVGTLIEWHENEHTR